MKSLLLNKKTVVKLILSILFVTIFFFTSCNTSFKKKIQLPLTSEEVKDLEYFLNLLLFENHGAFVMFGSKPISDMTLIDTERAETLWEQKLASMSEEERAQWNKAFKEMEEKGDIIKPGFLRNPFKGWLAWEKINNRFNKKRFLMLIKPQAEGSAFYDLLLVDILKTALILAQHYDYFKEIAGTDFDAFGIIYELENPQSLFWDRVFQLENHLAKGLLFGYGKKNALIFDCQFKHLEKKDAISQQIMSIPIPVSFEKEVKLGQGSLKNFTIPRFGVIDRKYVRKYQKEKKEIENYYRGKAFLQATLEKIFDYSEEKSKIER